MRARAPDPPPRIIALLREFQRARPETSDPRLHAIYSEFERIVRDWDERESVPALRAALGVANIPRGRRRTSRTLARDVEIVKRLTNAALEGRNVRSWAAAERILEIDAKQIERAWKSVGWMTVECLTGNKQIQAPRSFSAALKLLPPAPPDK